MTPETRLALECIKEATNRDEAALFAIAHGYDVLALDNFTIVSENCGWRLDLHDNYIEARGRYRDIPYSQIKHVLQEEVARDLS